jgi:hypothetical protein
LADKPKDDPLKWAEKKGFKTPEDMARALLQKEQEFHKSRQQKEREAQQQTPPPPAWQPRPDMGGFPPPPPVYGYPPQPPRIDDREIAAQLFPNMNPDDAKVFIPAMFEVANAAARRERFALEQQFGPQLGEIRRSSQRNNELMSLMQDPAFRDERVQREVHAVLDSDPSLFQREGTYSVAFEKALSNMARKQLQQGVTPETNTPTNRPPVTAGGGNGSAFTAPQPVTEALFNSWTDAEQDAYVKSAGRIVPKR